METKNEMREFTNEELNLIELALTRERDRQYKKHDKAATGGRAWMLSKAEIDKLTNLENKTRNLRFQRRQELLDEVSGRKNV